MTKVGDAVTFVDSTGKERNALVTAVWGNANWKEKNETPPSLNLVVVANDEAMVDQYGRQVSRTSSVVHEDQQTAHGMYWK